MKAGYEVHGFSGGPRWHLQLGKAMDEYRKLTKSGINARITRCSDGGLVAGADPKANEEFWAELERQG